MALWGGRFEGSIDDAVFALSRSVHFDWRLAPYDIAASLAHLQVLEASKTLAPEISARIRAALLELRDEVRSGRFEPKASDEDVHSALERGLTEKLGEIGGAIRAGRSRNDQVATDFKLYLLDHLLEIAVEVGSLARAVLEKSAEYQEAVAPGFTHLQHAQPVSFGQELAKHAFAFERDLDRIRDWYQRSNLSPLGCGALSGSSLALDPVSTSKALGFDAPVGNSIDGVSDRDFAAEALFILALLGVHLSKIGEEWTIWSATEFGWAILDDRFATGSSIMPQKKNPDIAELARGRAGTLIGNLTALLATMKSLPFAYNRDLQEDKQVTFSSVEGLLLLLPALTGLVSSTKFDTAKMAAAAPTGFSLATEIADYLVRKGLPFAVAHEAAGKCVKVAESRSLELIELSEADLLAAHPDLDLGVREFLSAASAVAARTTVNGTAPRMVAQANAILGEKLTAHLSWIDHARARFSGMLGQ